MEPIVEKLCPKNNFLREILNIITVSVMFVLKLLYELPRTYQNI